MAPKFQIIGNKMSLKDDKFFMKLALEEAQKALDKGNYPVGAVLSKNSELIGAAHNQLLSNDNWFYHAELLVIIENSEFIKKSYTHESSNITLYTTLEPCLMCLGALVLHRISRVVIACPDPHGGATHIDPVTIKDWYAKKWPAIEFGLYYSKAYEFLLTFLQKQKKQSWRNILHELKKMNKAWILESKNRVDLIER